MSFKSKSVISLIVALMLCISSSAMACTAMYVGSGFTADGTTMFGRSEDISNSYNKIMFVNEAGTFKAGEEYQGCYGFTYTFTHDSYAFNSMSDDNGAAVENVCPDCGSTHKHNPYGAAGTNEKGVTVTATETISGGSKLIKEVDPFNKQTGIEEAEIPTVLLSEAATAKEAVELLVGIYANVGAQGGSGIFIADNTETWYVENVSGKQYIAIKCSDNLVFAVPNQSAIGLIDLDDTENVIASENLIAVAKQAGTYVGDEAANTIDFIASYLPDQVANSRYFSALNHFNAAKAPTTQEAIVETDYAISNVDANGNIVPMYTNIELDHPFAIADVIAYWDIPGIGSTGNLDCHIFQISKEDALTDTVEWIAMDNGCYNVFVPYYPMLTNDFYGAYKVSTAKAAFVTEQPTEGIFYATEGRVRTAEGVQKVAGFKVLPENWADSYYWTFDALSNICEFNGLTAEQIANVEAKLAELQNDAYAAMADMQAKVAEAADPAAVATQISAELAEKVHTEVVALVNAIK
ncbi:MAG: C69 family dipeptidase [Clostridia bacterium]|nr:C69 family dipeptidase [Clostridia bacterium]